MVRKTARAALALVSALLLVTTVEASEFGVLVEGKGAEETYYACSGCHSEKLVAQQGLTRERWDELIEWMIEEQGMPELVDSERKLILDYLAENYGPDRPNFPFK